MLKLGEKIISDIYLGDKKIAKVFWGDKLVYQANKPIFLDYIEFDGASYIDTGVVPIFGDEFEITAIINGSATMALFGAGVSDYQIIFLTTPGRIYYKYFETGEARLYKYQGESLYTIKCFGDGSLTTDGQVIFNPVENLTPQTVNTNLIIGSRGGLNNRYVGKIGASKLTGADGTIKLDLRPCIDPKGVVCFYDMVTKKYFYNQGTGTLTAGNKIKFVDYISFDGESWVDVEYIPSSNTRVVGKVSFTQWNPIAGANYVFGVFGGNANFGFNVGAVRTVMNVPWGSTSGVAFNNNTTLGQVYSFDISKNGAYLDGILKIATSQLSEEFTATKSFFVGWANGTSTQKLVGNIYPMQMYENDVLVKDLKPCVVAGEACFYDMVTGKVFTNAGTGTLKASGRFVQSILFDGASWIDTGIKHQTCTVETTIRFEETGTRQLMGFGSSTSQYWGKPANNVIIESLGGSNATDKTDVILECNCDNSTAPTLVLYADGRKSAIITGKSIGTDYIIGALVWGSSATTNGYHCTCEVWRHKFTINGEVIQDLRPYVDENGTACFKDVITGNLFYNQGTGKLEYTE